MTKILKVTYHPVYTDKKAWVGYTVSDGLPIPAVIFEFGKLDALRDWAIRNGYDYIQHSKPEVPLKQIIGFTPIFADDAPRVADDYNKE